MKTILFLFLFFFVILLTQAQDKKDLMISLGIGIINTPENNTFKSPQIGIGYTFDADYFISKKHIFSISYTSGNHEYISNYVTSLFPSTSTDYLSKSILRYRAFSLMYKYRIINTNRFSIALGTGLSLLTEIRRFPRYEFDNGLNTWLFKTFDSGGGTDLAFPLKAEISYNLSNRWAIGLVGGGFIMPDYPILATHLIPRITFIIK